MTQGWITDSSARTSVRIEEVAQRAGVSTATVSRVLNGKGKCSAETRERVLSVVEQLGYVPNAAARNLAQGKTGNLGLLLPSVGTDLVCSVVQAVATAADEAGYDLLLAVRPEGSNRGLLGRHNTDGVLLFGRCVKEASLHRLIAEGCPALMMYQTAPRGIPLPSVLIEDTPGERAVVEHLLKEHGRRRVAFLRGPAGNESSSARERGYRQALAESGVALDPALVRAGRNAGEAQASVAALLRSGAQADAIAAWTDSAAVGALDALRRAGKRVPEDVSVVGFDDARSARYLDPPLTTVRSPTRDVGHQAVQELVRLVESGSAARKVLLRTELVVRRSCGCAG